MAEEEFRPHASHGPRALVPVAEHRPSRSRQPLNDDTVAALAPFYRVAAAAKHRFASTSTELQEVLSEVFEGADPGLLEDVRAILWSELARTGKGLVAIGAFFEEMDDIAVNVSSTDVLTILPSDAMLVDDTEAAVEAINQNLTPDERDLLRDVFILLDTSGDGLVDKAHLLAAAEQSLGTSRFAALRSELEREFEVADLNQDGKLSLLEFCASFARGNGVLPSEVLLSGASNIKIRLRDDEIMQLVANFRSSDVDHDGFLTQAELLVALRDIFATGFSEERYLEIVKIILQVADRDEDGKLSVSEFIRSFQEDQGVLPPTFAQSRHDMIAGLVGEELLQAIVQMIQELLPVAMQDAQGATIVPKTRHELALLLRTRLAPDAPLDDIADRITQWIFNSSERSPPLTMMKNFLDDYATSFRPVEEQLAAPAPILEDERLSKLFDLLDNNADGFIEGSDLIPLIERLVGHQHPDWDGAALTSAAQTIFNAADTDKDKRLSRAEFLTSFELGYGVLPDEFVEVVISRAMRGVPSGDLLNPIASRTDSLFSEGEARGIELLFETLDVNSTGFLEPHKIVPLIFNVIAAENSDWAYDTIDRTAWIGFQQADADRDGKLSLHDWMTAFERGTPVLPLEEAERILQMMSSAAGQSRITPKDVHNLTYTFTKFDRAADGFIDFAALRVGLDAVLKFRHPDWTANRIDIAVQCMLNAADWDRDGKLSLGEFVKSFTTGASVLPLDMVTEATLWQATGRRSLTSVEIDQLRAAFNDIDINKDGNISKVELTQLLQESNLELSSTTLDEVVARVIASADSNDDGEVSFEEFVTAFEADPTVLHLPLLAARERIARAEASLANLLAEEEMRKIARVFVDLDVDKNGVLDFAELHDEMSSAMMAMHPDWDQPTVESAVRAVFDAADVNGDGMLSLEEFISTFANRHYVLPQAWLEERSNKLTRRLTSEELDELKQVFHAIDVNNDGVLSTKELEALMRESLQGTMQGDTANINAVVAAVLHVVDTNNDGCVSFSEFVEAYQKDTTVLDIPIMAAAARREVAERKLETMLCAKDMRDLAKVFLHLDKNGDGFLSQETLRTAMLQELRQSHPEWSDDKLKASVISLLNSADINHDGRLSLDEFIATFVAGHYVLPARYVKDVAAIMSRKLSDDEVQEVENVFRSIDSKGDGFVTPQMLRKLLHQAVDEQTAEAIVGAIMLVADENNDGRLSIQEFVRCYQLDNSLLRVPISMVSKRTLGKIAAKVVPKDKVRDYGRLFHLIDKNQDNYIDLPELVEAMIMYSPGADPEGIEAVAKAKFLQADMDDDDLLSLDEFVASFTNELGLFFTPEQVARMLESCSPSPTAAASSQSSPRGRASVIEVVPEAPKEQPPSAPVVVVAPPQAAVLTPTPPRNMRPGEAVVRSPYRNVSNVAVFDDDLRELFDKYDRNRNGFLDVKEFMQAYQSLEHFGVKMSEKEAARIVAQYSPNGKLTYDAFCILMLKRSRM